MNCLLSHHTKAVCRTPVRSRRSFFNVSPSFVLFTCFSLPFAVFCCDVCIFAVAVFRCLCIGCYIRIFTRSLYVCVSILQYYALPFYCIILLYRTVKLHLYVCWYCGLRLSNLKKLLTYLLTFTVSPSFLYLDYMFCLSLFCWISVFFTVFRIISLSFAVFRRLFGIYTDRSYYRDWNALATDPVLFQTVDAFKNYLFTELSCHHFRF